MKCLIQVHTENNWQNWAVNQGGLFPKSELLSTALSLFWNLIQYSFSGTPLSNLLFLNSLFYLLLPSLLSPLLLLLLPSSVPPITHQPSNQSQNLESLTSLKSLYCHTAQPLYHYYVCYLSSPPHLLSGTLQFLVHRPFTFKHFLLPIQLS